MPELGKYTFIVLASYGATLALLGAIILLSAGQARRAKRRLKEAEGKNV
ncbi:heme exporter protein CcmD [Harenicola maris]